MIQGEEDPKRHLKATAQPGGHAAGAGEYSKGLHVFGQKAIESIHKLLYRSHPVFSV